MYWVPSRCRGPGRGAPAGGARQRLGTAKAAGWL